MKTNSFFKESFLFGLVGSVGFLADTSVLYLLKSDFGHYWARAISFFCAVGVTWILNRRLTFRHKTSQKSQMREFLYYLSMMLAGGAINYLTFAILVSQFEIMHRQPIWAVAAGSLAGMFINYLQLRYLMFRHVKL